MSSDRLNNQQCGNPHQIVKERFVYVGLQEFGCPREYLRWAVDDLNPAILDGNGSRLTMATCNAMGLKATILRNTVSRAYGSQFEIQTHKKLFDDESIPGHHIMNRQVGVTNNSRDKPSAVFMTHFGPPDKGTYVEYLANQEGRLHEAPDGYIITINATATVNGVPVIFSANRKAASTPRFKRSDIHTTPTVHYFDKPDLDQAPSPQLSSAMISHPCPGPLSPDLAKDGEEFIMVIIDVETTGFGRDAAVVAYAAAAYSINSAGTHERQSTGAGNLNPHPRPNFAPSDFARQDIMMLLVPDICTNVNCWIGRHAGASAGVCCDS